MSGEHDAGRGGDALRLVGELVIYQAAAVKERLQTLLREDGPVRLDLSGITEIDTAGLQLIAFARREALRGGRGFSLPNASPAVAGLMDLLGLDWLVAVEAA